MSIFETIGDAVDSATTWVDENADKVGEVFKEGGELLDTLGIIDYEQTASDLSTLRTNVTESISDSKIGQSVASQKIMTYLPWVLGAMILIMVVKR